MQLLLLGTTGYHPTDQRHTACLMFPECGLVLDAGTAMFRVRAHLQTTSLDIFLTHAHLDHSLGLTYLFDVLWQKEMQRVAVHAEPDKISALEQHLFSQLIFPVKPPFDFVPLGDGTTEFSNDARISHFPLAHPGGAIGYRIDWPDRSFAYVTDTTADPEAAYVDAIRGVDVLVHECYFADGWEEQAKLTGHSCTTPVAQVAAAAGVGRLYLVHVNPLSTEADPIDLPAARKTFANTEIAYDNMKVDF